MVHIVFYRLYSFLTVVHFHAPWAPQCTQMNDVMTELATDNSHVKFYKVDVHFHFTVKVYCTRTVCCNNYYIAEQESHSCECQKTQLSKFLFDLTGS